VPHPDSGMAVLLGFWKNLPFGYRPQSGHFHHDLRRANAVIL
jgi:hypothetical protein